jgi:CDP-diacylglycerol--glycerol-3-phosphate 3-phosphatidyltransferase
MWANLTTLLRLFLTFGVLALIVSQSQSNLAWAFWLTIVVIWMDGLDGFIARKFNESSTFGAVWDILADRIVEQVYWVTFACLGWIALWVPLVIITRGVLVDGVRALALQQGFTAFGQTTMMKHPLAILLVSSRFSRWTYAVVKAVVFAGLVGYQWLLLARPEGNYISVINQLLMILTWVTVAFCIIRGLPVLLALPRFIQNDDNKSQG